MTLTKLLDKVAGRRQARSADYRDIVRAVADGKEPDAELVDRILLDNGKTPDDLRKAVELLVRRRTLRRMIESLPNLALQRAGVQKRIDAADRVLKEAEDRHDQATAPLYARLQEIKEATSAGEDARRELEQTCADEALLEQARAVAERLQEAHSRCSQCAIDASTLRASARADRDESEHARTEAYRTVSLSDPKSVTVRIAELRRRADHRDERARELEAEAAKQRREVADLEHQEAAVRERMLEP